MATEASETPIEVLREEAKGYSVHDQQYAKNPWDLWKRFREAPELLHSDQEGGFWALCRYEEVRYAATHEESFCARFGRALPPHPQRLLPSDSDGAQHREYRRILNPWMTHPAMSYMEPEIHRICRELLGPLASRTDIDLANEYSAPAIMMCGLKWLDWPVGEWKTFLHWAHNILIPKKDPETSMRCWTELSDWVAKDLARRRGEDRGDIIDAILKAEVDGRPIDDSEALQLTISIFLGAVDTTASTLNSSFHWLAHHPEARDLLRSDAQRLPLAVEEFVRLGGTIAYVSRTVTQDTEVRGCPVREGDRVGLFFSAANRDADEFPDADEVVLDRRPNRHLGFGAGPHKCAGAPFARMMLRITIQEALENLGEFEVADESGVEWQIAQVRLCERLPIKHQPR